MTNPYAYIRVLFVYVYLIMEDTMKDLVIRTIDRFPVTTTIIVLVTLFTILNVFMWILTYIVVG
jgi:hypothetical protein